DIVTPVLEIQADLLGHPIGSLLALERVVIQRSIARHMLFVERGHAKNHVVIRRQPVHPADRGYWGASVLVIRAAGVAPLPIIDNSPPTIHPGAIVELVGNPAPLSP